MVVSLCPLCWNRFALVLQKHSAALSCSITHKQEKGVFTSLSFQFGTGYLVSALCLDGSHQMLWEKIPYNYTSKSEQQQFCTMWILLQYAVFVVVSDWWQILVYIYSTPYTWSQATQRYWCLIGEACDGSWHRSWATFAYGYIQVSR